MLKNLPANAEDLRETGLIPESGRFPERGNGNPLQYSCLENPLDRGAWQAIVHGIAESDMTERLTHKLTGITHSQASLIAQLVETLPAVQETQVRFLGWKDPWRRTVFLPGESHGQRSLAGYSPWGRKS